MVNGVSCLFHMERTCAKLVDKQVENRNGVENTCPQVDKRKRRLCENLTTGRVCSYNEQDCFFAMLIEDKFRNEKQTSLQGFGAREVSLTVYPPGGGIE